jgi:ATP-binding cassette subfamily A (ABC1) protein 3
MTSANSWKLRALMKKNLLILKRNIISTLFEILFPIVLILLCYAIKQAFKLKISLFEEEETDIDTYIKSKSLIYKDGSNAMTKEYMEEPGLADGLSLIPAFKICSAKNSKNTPRPIIASIGIPNDIKTKINTVISTYNGQLSTDEEKKLSLNLYFKDFGSVDELDEYVQDRKYGKDGYPLICFGISFKKEGNKKYDYALHYFDSIFDAGIKDVPNAKDGFIDQFSSGPDISSFKLYQTSGYTYIMKLIHEYILKEETGNEKSINFGIVAMPYKDYRSDTFSYIMGFFVPFCIVIAYMCPLCLYVYRMVSEKENKSKEGMKIMGLGEGIYFLSYFIQYAVISLIDSIVNTCFLSLLFPKIPFYFLFIVLFLWTLDVFALIFFFQSFIDKTRVALILSLLIYFVMFFLSMSCMDENSKKVVKIILSIFPPVCLELGVVLFGKFESHFRNFHPKDYAKIYTNCSIFIMNLMQIIDFFLYLFLGYYLQNVLPHEFGIRRPWYFLFTKEYWCGNQNKNKQIEEDMKQSEENEHELYKKKFSDGWDSQKRLKNQQVKKQNTNVNNKNFEEDINKDKTNPDDALRIQNIVKIFEEGKKVVDNVSLNFYKDEIFALLGHNGAGKTTLISMLTGLYEATEGSAYYDGYDILDSNNMDKFRKILGICPQHDVLFDDLSIREHLEMFCIFKGYSSDDIDNEINKTLNDFELNDIQNILAKNLSAGQRRKLSIAISLIGGSKVIFLDEPSSGMDITSRRNLWDILKRQSDQKIIILTTHYMEEASVLGKRIGIINAGKMKCIGSPLFLIERFGKFLSLNITKEEGAENDKIINFIQKRASNIEYEILSEEILIRIPKDNYIKEDRDSLSMSDNKNGSGNKESNGLSQFFDELDKNLKALRIKTYSASMPTLEDVFLNVAANDSEIEEEKMEKQHLKISSPENENDKILFETDFREDYSSSGKSKFLNDFKACFHRRYLLTSRDIKGFLMEILCPILLVLVGLLVSQVDILNSTKPQRMDMGAIGKQIIYYGSKSGITEADLKDNYYFKDINNITCNYLELNSGSGSDEALINNFVREVYDKVKDKEDSKDHEVDMMSKDYIGVYGSFLLLQDDINGIYFIEVLNTRISHAVPIYSYFFFKKVVEAKVPGIEISFLHYPLPLTAELKQQSDQTSNMLVILFVAIAFSLIPANFVTIIVKEKLNNSKHLMRVSGINIAAYWIVNFIFELAKYYFSCGVCLLLLWAFGFYKDYLYILYLIYGPSMISMTYVLSFLFDSESGAQNGIILLNFLLGALGATIIMSIRGSENMKEAAKFLQYILSLLPSFCFDFGYSLLLNKIKIYLVEYPNDWFKFKDSILLKKFNLLLSSILFLSVEFFVYTIILALIELFSYHSGKVEDSKLKTEINDSQVLKEIEMANSKSEIIGVTDENRISNKKEYALRIKNLRKDYSNGMCSKPTTAIKNMSFCVRPGECFGLLGLNGAGKTTTFKCITQELSPTHGKIYANGKDMRNNFSELNSVFGYCPQFDAIFEYMTVYENLEFYGKIKGIKTEYLDKVVNAMIEEMSLGEFTTKIAGRLSGGNKRKLSVAISLLCSPPIVLLDEPSTGMDPEARRFMWSVIHKISTKGKKASVIMTTHSMDEAETLCRRMAIMVDGEFVCLGKSGQIKQKYGYGYEIEVRIKPLSENKFESIINQYSLDKDMKIDMNNINQILSKINESNYIEELKPGRLGSKIIRDLKVNGYIPIRALISWTYFIRNSLKFIKKVENYFESIILTEHIDNNFLFKVKKNKDTKSIGFFFGLFESNRDSCYVTEYSIQQTSLEQIFNMFEDKKRKANLTNKENGNDQIEEDAKKEEIIINSDIYNALLK